jgi:hypothetical protein
MTHVTIDHLSVKLLFGVINKVCNKYTQELIIGSTSVYIANVNSILTCDA